MRISILSITLSVACTYSSATAFTPVRFSSRLASPVAAAHSTARAVAPRSTVTMGNPLKKLGNPFNREKRASVAKALRKRAPKSAVALMVAFAMRGSPARAAGGFSAAPMGAPPASSTWQAPDGEYRPRYESAAAKNAKKGDGAQVVIGGVLTVATVLRMKSSGENAQKKEKERITSTLENMQLQQQEFMDVQGEARSDQDMFASLRERAVDLEGEEGEEEMEREEGTLLTAKDTAEADEGAAGGGSDGGDSFDALLGDAKASEKAEVADGKEAEAEGEEAADEGPALGSASDVEMLKRMFGETSESDPPKGESK